MYHLVDEVRGDVNSRRIIESFRYVKDLKQYVVAHTRELYGFLPDIKEFPDYTGCKTLNQLKYALNKHTYLGWGLMVVKSRDKGFTNKNISENIGSRYYITIKPMNKMKRRGITDNGVMWAFLVNLSEQEKVIVASAEYYRVLHSTPLAVLTEWVGKNGVATLWVPKSYLIKPKKRVKS